MTHPIRVARKANGLTQKELGAMCNLSPSLVCRIELGASTRVVNIQAIAKALNVEDYRTLLPEVRS